MKQRQLVLPGPVVKKSNALARASWSVRSVYEPRIVALVASKVDPSDQDFQDYEIPIAEILGDFDCGRSYKLLSEAVEGLLGRVLTLPRANGWAKVGIFSYCEYDGKEGVIRARFDPSLKDHYLNLKSYFTQYSLYEYLLLPSVYSQRLFELLKSWANLPEVEITLSDLRDFLTVPDALQRYPDFRRRVLEKAHKDITGKTSLYYDWKPIKKGRSVHSILFTFGRTSAPLPPTKKDQNLLFKRAVACYEKTKGNCKPDERTKLCNLCLRLVYQK
ncbi:MAG: replication initiation protein [Chloroflexi bacterium]|nr:replication initiation protein [Chloroflexota bacterium]